uniref:Uncharacterized protein n=1 Tax=Anguilla anguilla TaxID=7936 RepID=A0A0E9T518_ANGAN
MFSRSGNILLLALTLLSGRIL